MIPSQIAINHGTAILIIGTIQPLASYVYTGLRRMVAQEQDIVMPTLSVWKGYFMICETIAHKPWDKLELGRGLIRLILICRKGTDRDYHPSGNLVGVLEKGRNKLPRAADSQHPVFPQQRSLPSLPRFSKNKRAKTAGPRMAPTTLTIAGPQNDDIVGILEQKQEKPPPGTKIIVLLHGHA